MSAGSSAGSRAPRRAYADFVEQTGSRTAGYVIGVVLLIPLVLLGATLLGYMGWTTFIIAAGVTAACALVAWVARLRAA